jgi:hypothetical protein
MASRRWAHERPALAHGYVSGRRRVPAGASTQQKDTPFQAGEINGEIEVFGDLKAEDQVVRLATDAIHSGDKVQAKTP